MFQKMFSENIFWKVFF